MHLRGHIQWTGLNHLLPPLMQWIRSLLRLLSIFVEEVERKRGNQKKGSKKEGGKRENSKMHRQSLNFSFRGCVIYVQTGFDLLHMLMWHLRC